MLVKGIDLENLVEDILIKCNVSYKREGIRKGYRHLKSKGKFDFEVFDPPTAIECKVITRMSLLTLPGLNQKTGKMYSQPMIKAHQILALRRFKEHGWLIVFVTEENRFYGLNMASYEQIIISNPRTRTLNGLMNPVDDIETFITKVTSPR